MAPAMTIKARILHNFLIHIITPRTRAIDNVAKLERFCLCHLLLKKKASLPSIIKYHMMPCGFKGTKIPYGMLFTKIFRHHMVDVATLKGMKSGSEITMKNIKQMAVKVSNTLLSDISPYPTHQQPSASKLPTQTIEASTFPK